MGRCYRGRMEIVLEILRAALRGAKKTHIMYRANLNYVSFNKYFPALLEEGLMVKADDPDGFVLYRTSEKGRVLLKKLSEVEKAMPNKKRVT